VRRQVLVGPVEQRLVLARLGDADAGIVRHPDLGRAAEVLKGADVGPHPRRQVLVQHRLRVGQVRRAEHREEEHRLPALPGDRIRDVDPAPAEVDEGLLAGMVGLAHRRGQRPRPAQVSVAELAVLEPARRDLLVLLPQQLLGDVPTLQFAVDVDPVGLRPVRHRVVLVREEEPFEDGVVVELHRQRPGQPRERDAAQILAHRAGRQPTAPRDGPARMAGLELQPDHLSQLPHR
jgi:hypothetical protein